MKLAVIFILSLAPLGQAGSPGYFVPSHRVSGIGVARDDLSSDLLEVRTDLMIQSQTFGILRDPRALPGAKRITSPRMQELFRSAAKRSGLPESLLEAIAFLESWGEAKAESPTGPKGVMQISAATARTMGIPVVTATRYHVARDRVLVSARGQKPKYKTVTKRTPYTVVVRDDRLIPERAIPAAAVYLAGLERKFGGRDWAIFAYHCGPGCVAEMQELTRRARGIPHDQITVARMFFSANPARNRELYEAIQQQMQRDYSPTYYFRIIRAEQLLDLYRRDPEGFTNLAQEYRSDRITSGRAPHRLSVWLKRDDLVFHSSDDIRGDVGRRLVNAPNEPEFFGYRLNLAADLPSRVEYAKASPAALGTLAYIAFETRRLHEELNPHGEHFRPLTVTSLVEPDNLMHQSALREAFSHSSGQVFDIDYSDLPPGELECLRFVLSDLGWDGFLGFVEEGRDSLHVGCSPTSRAFFSSVFQEATARSGE